MASCSNNTRRAGVLKRPERRPLILIPSRASVKSTAAGADRRRTRGSPWIAVGHLACPTTKPWSGISKCRPERRPLVLDSSRTMTRSCGRVPRNTATDRFLRMSTRAVRQDTIVLFPVPKSTRTEPHEPLLFMTQNAESLKGRQSPLGMLVSEGTISITFKGGVMGPLTGRPNVLADVVAGSRPRNARLILPQLSELRVSKRGAYGMSERVPNSFL